MTMYTTTNFKSKKAVKEALKSGQKIRVVEKTPTGDRSVEDENVVLSGPHYPEPHRWYGVGAVENGLLVWIK